MPFLKYPSRAFYADLHHVDKTIFIELLRCHFQWCKGDVEDHFYMTDRNLRKSTGCSLDTIWKSKKRLIKSKLISVEIGDGNKTYYTIPSLNGKPPLK